MTYFDDLSPDAVRAHDLARELPESAWSAVIEPLAKLVGPNGSCLDVGIGTGAVGRRLAASGVNVIGLDANATMLAALRAREESGPPVVLGDATASGGQPEVRGTCDEVRVRFG